MTTPQLKIYFSDFFDVDPQVLADYGALNISLINDLPLFIDPFLLYDSDNDSYQELHDQIVRYVKFLRDTVVSRHPTPAALSDPWFLFPEVRQNWLGYSKKGNRGTGLGRKFASHLRTSLTTAFSNFGEESISHGSHFEKICLLDKTVGRDHISDFITNIIKQFLLEYTQTFTKDSIPSEKTQTFSIRQAFFDYDNRRWRPASYILPAHNDDFVLLTPRNILTMDEAWINRKDMIRSFQDVCRSIPDPQLRAQVNNHFHHHLSTYKKQTASARSNAAWNTVRKFPEIADYYILDKEDNADSAHQSSENKVAAIENRFGVQIARMAREHLAPAGFYQKMDTHEGSLERISILKRSIEDGLCHDVFFFEDQPIRNESDLHLLYRLSWFAGGPRSHPVAFKLASNNKLHTYLSKAKNESTDGIVAIFHYDGPDYERAHASLRSFNLLDSDRIQLINCRASENTNVLLITSNPSGTDRIRVTQEGRRVWKISEETSSFNVDERHASTFSDLRMKLLKGHFDIIHLSGHGESEGFIFDNGEGDAIMAKGPALVQLISRFSVSCGGSLRCAVLGSCFSEDFTDWEDTTIPYVVVMSGKAHDRSCVDFTQGFYEAIASGKSVPDAFNIGLDSARALGSQNFQPRLVRGS